MKNKFLYGMFLMLSLTLMSSICSSNDDDGMNSNDNSTQIAQIVNTAESGTWIITSYIDSGQNDTNDFSGYNFTFATDGTLTADNDSTIMTGTWSVTDSSNSNDDSSSNDDDIDFNIFFPVSSANPFEDLNDDWEIVSYSSTKIDLIDISGGNGGTDTLTFEKN